LITPHPHDGLDGPFVHGVKEHRMKQLIIICALLRAVAASAMLVINAEKATIKTEGGPIPSGWNLWSNGELGDNIRITTPGAYQIIIRAWGSVAGGVWPEMALLVDGEPVKTVSVNSTNHTDYSFTVNLPTGIHEIAAAFLNDAVIGKEDRNLYLERFTISGPGTVSLAAATELASLGEQREAAIIAATQPAIEKHRQSTAVLHIVSSTGAPVANANVTITQIRHEFLFGCNIYGFDHGATYRQRFAELFNYATVGFYWRWYERERGQPKYADTDKVVAWCLAHNIQMKGHPLLWGNEAGVPPWSHGQPAPDIQRQRVADIMSRYRDQIFAWEVVNEPSHLPEPKIDDPYRWARQINSNAYLIVNDYNIFNTGEPKFYMANSRRGLEGGAAGVETADRIAMMFGVHRAEEVGGGLVVRFALPATPVHKQTVAEPTQQAHHPHRLRQPHPTQVLQVRGVQPLVQAVLNAPRRPIVRQPLRRVQLFRRQAGHQGHRFGRVLAQLPAQQRHLGDAGKVNRLGARRRRAQHPHFGLALVDLPTAGQRRRRLRGENSSAGARRVGRCWPVRWAGCL
jgi:hypothetical protein